MAKRITLMEWIRYIDPLTPVCPVYLQFQGKGGRAYMGFKEIALKATPAEMEAHVSYVLFDLAMGNITIELIPPKQYSTRRP